LEERNRKKIIIASILSALGVSFCFHSAFFIATTVIVLLLFDLARKKDWRFSLKTVVIIFSCMILFNGNWLFSLSQGVNGGAGNVSYFTQADLDTFKTRAIDDSSVYATVLALQGYWGENQDRFVSVRENTLWGLAFILILALAVFGIFKIWKKDQFAKPLVVIFFSAFVLAIGIASPLFKPLALWLYDHMPFYMGLREPQKWAAVMVLVYAYFGGWGVKYLLEIKKIKDYRREIGICCALLPIIFSFSIVKGMHEHLAPHEFPVEWQDAKNYLLQNPADGKILFLPWHAYTQFDFANKTIINPARSYFGKNIIQGNNTEFNDVYSHAADLQTVAIEKYAARENNPGEKIGYRNFISDMKNLGIGRVMLAKTEDWQAYDWLDKINEAEKVLENDKIIIYDIQ
jgi:hypothetical protein